MLGRLPLDHIFATAARVYRRSRLHPAFLDWHASAAATTAAIASRQQHHRHAKAATGVQALVRGHLARRVPARRHPRKHVPVPIRASCTIQRAVRVSQARRRRIALARDSLKRKREKEERRERERRVETSRAVAKEQEKRDKSASAIQAVWRGVAGRAEGGARARRKLRSVLVDLCGGTGRMHRWARRDMVRTFAFAFCLGKTLTGRIKLRGSDRVGSGRVRVTGPDP